MKKLISVTLCAALALSAVGCSSGSGQSHASASAASTSAGSASVAEQSAPAAQSDAPTTLEEQVIYDSGALKVTVTGFDAESLFGPEVKMLVENSGTDNLTVQCSNCSVNGYMVEAMMSIDAAGGKKSNDGMTLLSSDIKESGIDKIAEIAFKMNIFNSDSYETLEVTPLITLTTNQAEGYQQTYDDAGTVLYEGNDVRIINKGLTEDSLFGPGLALYVENNSGSEITVMCENVSVNGFMVTDLFSCDVFAGMKALDSVTFMSSDLEENGIETISEVELSFALVNPDTYDRIDTTAPIKITL